MSISIEETKMIINEDVKEKHAKVVNFEILSAKYHDHLEIWDVEGNFSYEITNKTLLVGFTYHVRDDKVIDDRYFYPK